MSTGVLSLVAAGLVLLVFEVVVPGAILGVIGGVLLIGGVVFAYFEHGPSGGLLVGLISVAALGALFYLEFRVLPRTRLGRRMFLRAEVAGAGRPPAVAEGDVVTGLEGLSVTPLSPTGLVEVAGKRYEARCESGFAEAGARLRVLRVESYQLVVIAIS